MARFPQIKKTEEVASMAGRPREPMALKIAKGKKHLTKDEKETVNDEVYAAEGEIVPPGWLNGMALEHFLKQADYMRAVNRITKRNVYGACDAEALALMSQSYQMSHKYLTDEMEASGEDAAALRLGAQKKRMSEDRSYREFMKLLKLDPGSRVDVGKGAGIGDDDGESEF